MTLQAPPAEGAIDPHAAAEPTYQTLLYGVEWSLYRQLRETTDENGQHLRLVYDDGTLLIEMPNKFHEVIKTFIGRMLEAYLQDHDVDYSPLGSTTWQREIRQKGLEADECYYIQHVDVADLRDEVDLTMDPPPDLAIEVEVTNPLLPKLPVYAGIGIPEVWHLKGWDEVRVLTLDTPSGTYREVTTSVAVPMMTSALLRELIALRRTMKYSDAIKACRARWQ